MSRKQPQSPAEKIRAREWRALPQNVSLAGDTRPSKRRRLRSASRLVFAVALVFGIAALFVYVWIDMMAGLGEPGEKARVVGVEFSNDGGVLDEEWFRAWTNFDETRAPNLNSLRRRILEYPQVSAADIRRLPDGSIRVFLRERCPVARLVDAGGNTRLVADDGVVFPAETFPPSLNMLPIFEDAKFSQDPRTGFSRIEGIAPLVEFVTEARTRHRAVFAGWDVISLKDFPSDPRDVSLPWAAIRVVPKPSASNPAHGRIREIVFSADPKIFRADLRLLAAATADGTLDAALSAPPGGRRTDFRILFITNRKNPEREFREMRMIPVPAEAR